MRVSIVTVVLNNREVIGQAIESVLAQTYPDIEYIIVDGCSTDGTLEVIDQYRDRLAKVIVEKDKGIYDAMNKGLRACTGQVIGILNSDDFYANPKVIEKVVAQMQSTGADACYADLQYVDGQDTSRVVRHWRSGSYRRSSFMLGWMPPHPTFFIKRQAYLDHGYFELDLRSAADYELMLRMLYKHNLSACYLPMVTVKMRVGGMSNQSMANRMRANQEDRLAWSKNGLKPHFYTIPLKPVRKIPQFIWGKLGLAGKI